MLEARPKEKPDAGLDHTGLCRKATMCDDAMTYVHEIPNIGLRTESRQMPKISPYMLRGAVAFYCTGGSDAQLQVLSDQSK